MAKTFAGCTLEQVQTELVWVVKYMGHRDRGTMPELKARGFHYDDEDIREVDIAWKQDTPAMERFVAEWMELERKHGFCTLPELFEKYGTNAE